MTLTGQMHRFIDSIFILECCMGKPTNFVCFCRWANICYLCCPLWVCFHHWQSFNNHIGVPHCWEAKQKKGDQYRLHYFYLSEVAPEVGRGSIPGHSVWPASPQVVSVQSLHYLFWVETATSVAYKVIQLRGGNYFWDFAIHLTIFYFKL